MKSAVLAAPAPNRTLCMEQLTASVFDGDQAVCTDVAVVIREVHLPGGIQRYGWFPVPHAAVPVRIGGLYTLRADDGRAAPITITRYGAAIIEFILSGGLA